MSGKDRRAGRKAAFRGDVAAQAAGALAKALWWSGAGAAAKAITRPTRGEQVGRFQPKAPPTSRERLRRAYLEAFAKDARDVAAGLYPPSDDRPGDVGELLRQAGDFLNDAREVDARRRRGDVVEVRDQAPSDAYPVYYRQNFHFQSGGWFTEASARRYEAQVEALFSGAAGAMRRRALSLLAQAWRGRDHRGLTVVDLAGGAGGFLRDLRSAFPRAQAFGLDLSAAYASRAGREAGAATVQANIERLPFADDSLDAATCVYLFHELPPRLREPVAAEIARVLRPGGVLAFADSVQPADEPELARMLEAFPAFFHEPYYGSYAETDLPALFGRAGLTLKGQDKAFLTKALLLEKPPPSPSSRTA